MLMLASIRAVHVTQTVVAEKKRFVSLMQPGRFSFQKTILDRSNIGNGKNVIKYVWIIKKIAVA